MRNGKKKKKLLPKEVDV